MQIDTSPEGTGGSHTRHTEVTGRVAKTVDNNLQREQHLYRKHLHIAASEDMARMLTFLIAFISFNLAKKNTRSEGM